MTVSAERREEIIQSIDREYSLSNALRSIRFSDDELRTLLHDSARLERIERQAGELADELTPYEPVTGEDEIHARLAGRLRAIVDTGSDK